MPCTLAVREVRVVRRAMRFAACGLLAVAAIAFQPAVVRADDPPSPFPEPHPFPTSWELKFRHTAPKRIVVQLPGQKFPAAYWYITYTVINRGEKEVDFQPEFKLVTEDGQIHAGNRAIPNDVFEEIKKKEGNKLLMSPRRVAGVINPGDEQARDSVAIWPEPQRKMGQFSIFVAGLSGETLMMKKVGGQFVKVDDAKALKKIGENQYVIVDPAKAVEELKDVKEEDRLMLRKQLHLRFQVMGDDRNAGKDPIVEKPAKWVMR